VPLTTYHFDQLRRRLQKDRFLGTTFMP